MPPPPLSLLLVGFGAACVVVRCVCFWVNFCVGCTAVGTGATAVVVVVCCEVVVLSLVVVVVVVCSVVVAVSLVVVVVALVVVVVCEVVVVSVSVSELLSAADDEPLSPSDLPETTSIIITAAITSTAAAAAIIILPFLDIVYTSKISFLHYTTEFVCCQMNTSKALQGILCFSVTRAAMPVKMISE